VPKCSRREFLKKVGKVTLVTGLAGTALSGCTRIGMARKSLEQNLSAESYAKLTKQWDPVYGPPIQTFSRYGGLGDFQGHIRGGAAPGIDYDVLKGTPLAPPMTSYLRQSTRDDHGALYLFLVDIFNTAYRIVLAHLEETLVDDRYLIEGEVMRYLGEGVKALGRGDIVAVSGNSGFGPREYGYVQPPHLHLSFHYWNNQKRILEPLDPEKYGIDGRKPVFWDGRTILDMEAGKRLHRLELTLKHLKEDLEQWPRIPELQELSGILMEYHYLLGDAGEKQILDSKHFHDMRALLKRVTLEEKKYLPGTAPYTTMLRILGYSTDEKQKVILTLPFMAPGLEKIYQRPVYEKGMSFTLIPHKN
jgi:hypothetical protein